jgi:molybdate transport system substrate-binding protein
MFERIPAKLIAVLFAVFGFSLAAQPLLVAAAADLAPLEAQLTRGYTASGGGALQFVFGSSGMLARQIENGAPYDVFLCANEQFVHDLTAQKHLIPASVAAYATGRLGLWSAHGTPESLTVLTDSKIRLIAIANPQHAPYGVAARALLERAGLWDRLQPKIVLAENVRQAYEYARTGNADVVITSWTLLKDEPGAKLLPASGHPPIRQSAGVVTGTQREIQARAFLRFLLSPAGQSILQAGGLSPIESTKVRTK